MNALGLSIVWLAFQVTIFAAVGAAAYAIAHRWAPRAAALAAVTSLLGVAAITALAFAPWPDWRGLLASADNPAETSGEIEVTESTLDADPALAPTAAAAATPGTADGDNPTFAQNVFWKSLADELRQTSASAPSTRWWPALVAGLFLAGLAIGLARTIAGIAAVAELRRKGAPASSRHLAELVDVLRAELGCVRPVSVRVSPSIATAATVGWRRPLILLPEGWSTWSGDELKAVLAHELAHIRGRDYLTWLAAQLGLVLHFYHPLVHWLAGRLRLEQELAADAVAAPLAGGQRAYLASLARLALAQSDRPVGWPARAFLPTRSTFVRRIEMLRRTPLLAYGTPGMRLRAVMLGVLFVAGLAIAGLRGPRDDLASTASAAQPPAATAPNGESVGGLVPKLIPAEAGLVAAIRPASLSQVPEIKKLMEMIAPDAKFGMPLAEVDLVAFAWFPSPDPRTPDSPIPSSEPAILLRSVQQHDWTAWAATIVPNATETTYGGRTFYKGADQSYYVVDDRTVVVGQTSYVYRFILRSQGLGGDAGWASAWIESGLTNAHAAFAADGAFISLIAQPTVEREPQAAPFAALSPLWKDARTITGTLTVGEQVELVQQFVCQDESAADRVAKTAESALTLARNMSRSYRERIVASPTPQDAFAGWSLGLFDTVLGEAKVTQEGTTVQVTSATDAKSATVLGALAPAVSGARDSARRAQCQNNLKQIALALHNYHDTYQGFPAPVLLGPDGRTPYSWRVAILPYIEQEPLFRLYKFDEPWDGPNNKRLLDKMPAIYRCPEGDAASTNAAYFVLSGPETVFNGNRGTRISEILDGTSYTIMVVEAERDIPWLKPEDIPYDKAQPLPDLGGLHKEGFNISMCDGSVRIYSPSSPEQTLRAMITKAGGEVLP